MKERGRVTCSTSTSSFLPGFLQNLFAQNRSVMRWQWLQSSCDGYSSTRPDEEAAKRTSENSYKHSRKTRTKGRIKSVYLYKEAMRNPKRMKAEAHCQLQALEKDIERLGDDEHLTEFKRRAEQLCRSTTNTRSVEQGGRPETNERRKRRRSPEREERIGSTTLDNFANQKESSSR